MADVQGAGVKRLKQTELVVPVVTGTVATPLPKQKASQTAEYATHKWTCYLRSATGEDLSHILKKVTFVLHPSFANPSRVLEQPPWEVTESGWGEFEISITMTFADDAHSDDLELFHRLKLFPDSEGAVTKQKTVVSEQYEEVIFWEPVADFHARVLAHKPTPAPPSPALEPYYIKFDEEVEVRKLTTARQRVAQIRASLQKQLDSMPSGH